MPRENQKKYPNIENKCIFNIYHGCPGHIWPRQQLYFHQGITGHSCRIRMATLVYCRVLVYCMHLRSGKNFRESVPGRFYRHYHVDRLLLACIHAIFYPDRCVHRFSKGYQPFLSHFPAIILRKLPADKTGNSVRLYVSGYADRCRRLH